MNRGYEYCSCVSLRRTFVEGYVFVVQRLTIRAQTVALKLPSTRFAVSMVITLADVVAEAADAVDVVIDCAAAETANTTGMAVYKRMVLRESVYVGTQDHDEDGLQIQFITARDEHPELSSRYGTQKVVYGDIDN
jgi:hypothetical protein